MPGFTANNSWRYPLPGEIADQGATQKLAFDMEATYTSIDSLRTQSLRRPTASITSTLTQSATKNTAIKMLFDTVKWDTDAMSNLGVSNDRLTIKTAGLYYVMGSGQITGFTPITPLASGSFLQMAISKNAVTTPVSADFLVRMRYPASNITSITTFGMMLLAVNDTLQLYTQWGGASMPAGPLNASLAQLNAQLIARNP